MSFSVGLVSFLYRFVSLCVVFCVVCCFFACRSVDPSASHQDLARAQTAFPTMISDAAFRSEIERLEHEPISELERLVATRALVRYERHGFANDDVKICANEDWIRLFIALRRAHSPHTRITPALLRDWKTKVASSTVVMRKCYIVETAALDALPQYPPDLDKWIIPGMSWCSRLTSILTEP